MPHSFLIFDFGTNEEAVQQARHRLEGWRQGFRLDKKLQLKFERKELESAPVAASASAPGAKSQKSAASGKTKGKPAGKSKFAAQTASEPASKDEAAAVTPSEVRLIVRLDFSDHEKLSHQRWIDRIPTEEPFKGANPRVVRTGEPDFKDASDLFDSLD